MITIEKINNKNILFEIPLPKSESVYMSLAQGCDFEVDAERFVVFVNSNKFLKLWQNLGEHSNCKGIALYPDKWPYDYKYHYAEEGFAAGRDNPVPLADISARREYKHTLYVESIFRNHTRAYEHTSDVPRLLLSNSLYINHEYIDVASFHNGITRTLWLLNNHATCFPIQCHTSSLSTLLKAREKGTTVYCVADFFDFYCDFY